MQQDEGATAIREETAAAIEWRDWLQKRLDTDAECTSANKHGEECICLIFKRLFVRLFVRSFLDCELSFLRTPATLRALAFLRWIPIPTVNVSVHRSLRVSWPIARDAIPSRHHRRCICDAFTA